jgi:hypothetical protein
VDTRSLSYDELADLLGIERESARHLTFRRRWRRTKGNDGKTRVEVPLEAIPAPGPAAPTGDNPLGITGAAPDTPMGSLTGSETVLTRHIERLEGMLAEAQARLTDVETDRDAARDEARDAQRARDALSAQVDALNAVLTIERERIADLKTIEHQRTEEARQKADDAQQRAEELRAERDRWLVAAETAQGRIAALTAKAAEADARRPWWKRLAG